MSTDAPAPDREEREGLGQLEEREERASAETPIADESITEPAAALAPFQLASIGGYTAMFALVTMLTKAVSFVMLPVYTRYLTPANYGAIELIELTFDVLTMVAGSRLIGGVFRHYYKASSEPERNSVVATGVLLICAGYFAVGLAAFFAATPLAHLALGPDPKYVGLVRIGALALSSQALGSIPPALFRLRGRFRTVVATQIARLAIQVTLNVLFLVHYRMGPNGIFLSTLIANVTVGGAMMIVILRQVGLHYSRHVATELYRFGGPLIAMQAATFILTFGDRPFLRAVTTLGSVGIYTMAYQFAFAFNVLTQTPFTLVWEPKRFEIANRPDRDAIYARVFVYYNVAALVAALAVAMFVHDFLHLIATPPFFRAADVVPLLLVAMMLGGWASAHEIGILMSERTGCLAAANWIAAGVTLVAYALLIPPFAGWGAALATVIGYVVRYGFTYRFSQRLWPVQYNWRPVWQIVALTAVAYGVSRFIPDGPLVYAMPGRIVLFLIYLTVVWHSPVLTERDRSAARRILEQVLRTAALSLGLVPRAVAGGHNANGE
jgi:O-antigen/teichoic acid export membrane protein